MSKELFLVHCLKELDNRGYSRAPLPQLRDEEIAQLIKAWLGLSEQDRREAELHISREQSFALITFGERMASLAVRECNAERILLGLLALGIEGGNSDWRENYLVVPLHYDAAQRIGVDAEPIFENVITQVGGTFAKHLRQFLQAPTPKKSIDVMGYQIGSDEQGFRYRRTW